MLQRFYNVYKEPYKSVCYTYIFTVTEWGKVTVCWWSHKIKGLHVNDFIMAAKTDSL
jgi:hypothetical protein